MCGIAGACSVNGISSTDAISAMIDRLRHRGPDDAGLWQSPSHRCVLGHTRLSIIDLSPAGHQPMTDPLTGNTLVFNGEIYNYQQHRAECIARGDTFRSDSDTEVILALYRQHGSECVRLLRGMFAFALWDEGRQRLILARDRLGKKPLHYALAPDHLIFSSEIEPISRHPSVSRALDDEALSLYLHLQYVPAPWTIYRAIRKLPPAHVAVWDSMGFRTEPYWSIDYNQKSAITEPEALEELDQRLREAIQLRMIADVPLGALLSGGVDSSLVVALMASVSGRPVKTFSIGFREQAFNELPYAELVSRRYHTEHTAEVIEGSQLEMLPEIARRYGEPYADPSAVPSFHVCRAARRQVTVAMNGDGGDELLGGYPHTSMRQWVSMDRPGRSRKPAADRLAEAASSLYPARTQAARLRRRWLFTLHPELRCLAQYGAFWSDREVGWLLRDAGGSPVSVLRDWRASLLHRAALAADHPLDRMLWIDYHSYLPGALLPKMDIASMHCSLEARSPLLDAEIVQFCAGLTPKFKVRGTVGKYLLKKLAERYLPPELLYRPKMGFDFPLAQWLRGSLRPVVESMLRDPDKIAPLSLPAVRRTVDAFYRDQVDHSSRLWALLMFALWKQECAAG